MHRLEHEQGVSAALTGHEAESSLKHSTGLPSDWGGGGGARVTSLFLCLQATQRSAEIRSLISSWCLQIKLLLKAGLLGSKSHFSQWGSHQGMCSYGCTVRKQIQINFKRNQHKTMEVVYHSSDKESPLCKGSHLTCHWNWRTPAAEMHWLQFCSEGW